MLNEDQIIKKLYDQVKIFKDHMMRKEYLQAVLCADQASMVVMCLDMGEEVRAELFGVRDKNNPVIGLIDEAQYIKALDWCIFTYSTYVRKCNKERALKC